jgi:hypothetical protein
MNDYRRDVVAAPGLVRARHEPPASLLGFGFLVEYLIDFCFRQHSRQSIGTKQHPIAFLQVKPVSQRGPS